MEKPKQFCADVMLFSADERAVLLTWLAAGGDAALAERLAAARRRTYLRQASDAETDLGRRILVGARIPRPLAERYRGAAAAKGMSLYRFVCNALEREYQALTGK